MHRIIPFTLNFWHAAMVVLAGFMVFSCQPSQSSKPRPDYVLVIHGGAGAMERAKMKPEAEQAYRPCHADYTYQMKYGIRASSGGGRSSAHETIGRGLPGPSPRSGCARPMAPRSWPG